MAYHQELHSETGQTPHERYQQEPRLIRNVDLGTVLTFFHQRVPRTVDEDHSDVRIDNLFFAVDPKLLEDGAPGDLLAAVYERLVAALVPSLPGA